VFGCSQTSKFSACCGWRAGTLIKGGLYRAKHKDYDDGFVGTVFSQVVLRGKPLKNGKAADTNYVWPSPWFLSNYFYRHLKSIDFNLDQRAHLCKNLRFE
jgi:hypothetical protein